MSTPPISSTSRPDIVATQSAPRPTAPPARVNFKQALANVAAVAGNTAEAAMTVLPGGTVISTALRGSAAPLVHGPMTTTSLMVPTATSPTGAVATTPVSTTPVSMTPVSTTPEGPGGTTTTVGLGVGTAGDPQTALAAAQANEMQMLVLQQQVSAQQNSFTTMSNVLKSQSDTERAAINNIK